MKIPTNLKYSNEHEWVSIEGSIATIGITDFAQSELGDIVFIDVEKLNETLAKDTIFGSIEAVKTVSDLFMPISGKIIERNGLLETSPETINTDPYNKGWIIKIEVTEVTEIDDLLDADTYKEMVEG